MSRHDIVAIGASAGGLVTVERVLQNVSSEQIGLPPTAATSPIRATWCVEIQNGVFRNLMV
jgi:hypothetical protein